MVSSHSLAHGRAATCRRNQRGTGDVLLRWRLHSGLCEASALRKRGSAPPTPPFGRGAGRAAARFGGSRACTSRPTCYGWPSRPCGAPACPPSCPKMPLAGHRLRLFWSGRGALGGPPLFERPPAFWPGFEGAEPPLRGGPSGYPPFGRLPRFHFAPASLKSRGPLASLGRAGLRPPCAGRPLGGAWVSALRSRQGARQPLRCAPRTLRFVMPLALRSSLDATGFGSPRPSPEGLGGFGLNASPRLRRPPGKSPSGLLVEYSMLSNAGFASCHGLPRGIHAALWPAFPVRP